MLIAPVVVAGTLARTPTAARLLRMLLGLLLLGLLELRPLLRLLLGLLELRALLRLLLLGLLRVLLLLGLLLRVLLLLGLLLRVLLLLGLLLRVLLLLGLLRRLAPRLTLRLLAWLRLARPLRSTGTPMLIGAAVVGLVGQCAGRCQSAKQQDQSQPSRQRAT
jgi:hypothetical protein